MEKCPVCNGNIKSIPAGISKRTGKAYKAFKVCENNDCGYKPIEEDGTKNVIVESLVKPEKPVEKPIINGDSYIEGKKENNDRICRTNLMVALLTKADNPDNVETLFRAFWKIIIEK